MQVSTQEIPFREESSLSLVPLAQGSSVRPQAGTHAFDAAQLPASCNLLDTSNRFGYTAAASASSSGFTLAQTSQIKSAFQRNEAAALAQGVHVDTQGQPVHFVRFAYADLYVAAVLQNGVLLLFSLKQLAQGQTAPLKTYQLPSPAVDLLPNPSDKPELLAVLLSTGQLAMFDINSSSNTVPTLFGASVVSACWSVKGKQIVCGLADASLVQFAPDGAQKGSVPAPTDLEEPSQIVDVRWLENDVFFISCAPVNNPTDGLPPLIVNYVLLRTKTSLTYCRLIDDPTQPFGTHETRPTRRFVANLKAAGPFKHLLVLAASNSPDIALLACNVSDGAWAVLEMDDNARASLPTTTDGDNTCPFGLTFDLTLSPSNETPCLLAYTSDASIIAWSLKSTSADLKSSLVAAEDLATASDEPQVASAPAPATAPSTPAAKPFGSSAVPSFSGAPSFGQSTFGQSGFGSPSGFGTPSTPATAPATSGSATKSAFGGFCNTASTSTSGGGSVFGGFAASSPGQSAKPTGFGSFSAASGSGNLFGSSSSSATPAFGSSTFGGPSAASSSAFGAGSRGGAAMGDDDDDDEPRSSQPASSAAAPGLGGMDADELEPQAKGDASASLGFGGFGLGASKPAANATSTASAPPNPMFGGFGASASNGAPATSQPAASGFSGFGQSSTGFGSSSAAPSTPSAFSGFGKPAFGASAQPTPSTPPSTTTSTTASATPSSSAFANFGKPAFGTPTSTTAPPVSSASNTPTSTPAPPAFPGFGKPAFGASTPPAAASSSGASASPSAFSGFGKPAFGAATQPAATTSTATSTTPAPTSTSAAAPSAFSGFGQSKTPSFSFGSSTPPASPAPASSSTESKPTSAFAGFGTAGKPSFGASSTPSYSSPLAVSSKPSTDEPKPSAFAGFGKPAFGASAAASSADGSKPAPAPTSPFASFGGKSNFSFGAPLPSANQSAGEAKPEASKFSFGSQSSSPLASAGTASDVPDKEDKNEEENVKEESDEGEGDEAEEEQREEPEYEASEPASEGEESSAPSEAEDETRDQASAPADSSASRKTEPAQEPLTSQAPSVAASDAQAPGSEEKPSPFQFPPAPTETPSTETSSAQSKPAFSFGQSFNFGASSTAPPKPSSSEQDGQTTGGSSFAFTKQSANESIGEPKTGQKAAAASPSPFSFQKPAAPSLSDKPSAPSFSFGQAAPGTSSSKSDEKTEASAPQQQQAKSKQDSTSGSVPAATKSQPTSTQSTRASTPQVPTPTQAQKTKEAIQAEGLGAEFLKLISLTDQDLVKLQNQVEERMAVLAQHKEPLQPVGGFPNSFDDGEWTMGDLAHLDTVSNKLLAVLDDVKTAQRKEQAGLLDLQNSCVKAQLKCAEIQRFKDNMANPEFHRQLKAQELGPEQAETQGHLRSLVSITQESLDRLEAQVSLVQSRMSQAKAGKVPLKVSSLEMIHQTMRNLSFSINARLSELTELSTRVDMLTRPYHGRSSKGAASRRLALEPNSEEEPLFKSKVSEENVSQLKEQLRTRLALRDVYLASKPRTRLNRTSAGQ